MRSVAVYSAERVGSAMAGPAIRYVEVARALKEHFDVSLVVPEMSVPPPDVAAFARPAGDGDLADFLSTFDAVFAQLLPLATIRALARAKTPVVYDLYNPFLAEPLAQLDTQPTPGAELFGKTTLLTQRAALQTGAAFVCASERQRDVWLGVLASLSRIDLDRYRMDPALRTLIDVVPFGLPETAPEPGPGAKGVTPGIRADDRLLLWAGGVWNWLDPLTVIRAVAAIGRRREDVKLLFLGVRHPDPAFPETAMTNRALALTDELGVRERLVFFNEGWVTYDERQRYLAEADIGVSAHGDTLEARYAFRARILDHFWADLPTVASRGDVLAELVEERHVGRTVAASDVDGWVAAVEAVLAESPPASAFELLRRQFAWPNVVRPLVAILNAARVPAAPRTLGLTAATERALRLRTSLVLGGAKGLARRRLERLSRSAGR